MNILYVCIHNSGRSQMAEAFTRELAAERGLAVEVESAGTLGGKSLNPGAVQVMDELGISMASQSPKLITQAMADAADRIITMGCGVDADACPARILVTEDWGLDDPAGQDLDVVRRIRDEVRDRVTQLLDEIAAEAH